MADSEKNMWEIIGNKCLKQAIDLLDKEAVPTAATVGTVKVLVDIAINIDALNLRWSSKNQFCGSFFQAPSFERQAAKN